ncbi:MAG TPA: stage II sporulation protein M, partial [Caulobacteraceae bacterium]|nr:stage II sporulation protein M [Caulobacteraceae bacterium]
PGPAFRVHRPEEAGLAVKDLQLKSQRFRAEREWDWRRLDGLLRRVESGSAASLSEDELLAIPVLYRSTLSSLSVARATSLDHSLIDYLESLSTRAYFFVYGARASLRDRIGRFFVDTWPNSVKRLWRETLIALALSVVATVVGYVLVSQDASWYASLVGGMSEGRDPAATTASLRETLYPKLTAHDSLSVLASFLFTHNSEVTLGAFALGFAFGAPTLFLLAQNFLMLGAFMALFVSRGLGWQLGGWLSVHGTTELFAVILGSAAGFRIGWAVAFPGDRTRIEAAAAAGRASAAVMGGVLCMLAVAGMLEGFVRQLVQVDWERYAIGWSVLALWLAYFYLPRPARPAS